MSPIRRHLLRLCLGLAVLCVLASPARAAGLRWFEMPADAAGPALQGALWYPCAQPAAPLTLAPLVIQAVKDCPLRGEHLPWIVISHGTGGSRLGHHDTAAALADAGFVVAAIDHPGDNYRDTSAQLHLSSFLTRPQDLRRLIDYLSGQWEERGRLDVPALGLFGFSRGGYTGLVALGAVPDFRLGQAFCAERPGLPFCQEMERPVPAPPDAGGRIRAAVIVDPVALFTPAGLRGVTVPIQLWSSALGGDGVTPAGVAGIRDGLPTAPEFHLAAGSGHFSFLAPCAPAQAGAMPELCRDGAGFDRAAFHRAFNAEVVRFFRTQLMPAGKRGATDKSAGGGGSAGE